MQELVNRLWVRAWVQATNLKREEGQAMTEYAVILTLIAVALVVSLGLLRGKIIDVIDAAKDAI